MSIFANIPRGAAVFVDANSLVHHFTNHPTLGAASTDLLERMERQEFTGYTSATVLGELSHRLMTVEAVSVFGWPYQGIANRLRRRPADVQQLARYRQAIDELAAIPIQILPITGSFVSLAADVTKQYGLLTNDALIVVVMQNNGLSHLASNDSDFDRVTGLIRYSAI